MVFSPRWLLLPGLVAGCGPSKAVTVDGPDDPVSPTTLPTVTVPTTPTAPAADALRVQDLLEGRDTVDVVVPEIAWSGGWPVRDGDTLWFVHWSDQGPVGLAGAFNDWTPTPMNAADGYFWLSVTVAAPEGQSYKFVGAGDSYFADPFARSYDYDAFGEYSYAAPPTDKARLDRWPGLSGEGLAPRDLRVHVPAGTGPWPVLYAHDGQNLFNPEAMWGGWRLSDALATRDPILVVGVDNTFDRMDEYTHVPDRISAGGPIGGAGDAYADLIDAHVRPHIESVYGSTGLDGVLGSSLGGLVSLHTAQRHPGRYDFAASLSGTLGWGRLGLDNDVIQERWLASPPAGTAVYVDSGGGPGNNGCQDIDGDGFTEDDPDSTDNYCESRQFVDALAASGYVWETDLWHWWEPDAPHAEVAWAGRVGLPLDRFLSLR